MNDEERAIRMALYLEQMREIVATHGHGVVGVFPTEDDPIMPFTYTVGLAPEFGYELVMVGLDNRMAARLLNDLVDRLRADGSLPLNEPIERILANDLNVVIVQLDSRRGVNVSRELYGDGPWVVRQVLWPDPDGVLPTEDGCDRTYVEGQRSPDLGRWAA